MEHSVRISIIIRSLASNLPLGVVMEKGRDILVKLEGFGGGLWGFGGERRGGLRQSGASGY